MKPWFKPSYGLMLVALCVVSLLLAACAPAPAAKSGTEKPAKLEKLGAGQPARVILTESGAKRLDLKTAPVRDAVAGGTQRTAIPYAAILYDNQGKTWTYTSLAALTFVRQPITVERISGDEAILSAGPSSGTQVVTVGVAELYGAETEFAK